MKRSEMKWSKVEWSDFEWKGVEWSAVLSVQCCVVDWSNTSKRAGVR